MTQPSLDLFLLRRRSEQGGDSSCDSDTQPLGELSLPLSLPDCPVEAGRTHTAPSSPHLSRQELNGLISVVLALLPSSNHMGKYHKQNLEQRFILLLFLLLISFIESLKMGKTNLLLEVRTVVPFEDEGEIW